MHLIMLILHEQENLEDLLNTWHTAGALQITSIHSSVFTSNPANQSLNEDFPLLPSLSTITDFSQIPSSIILAFTSTKEITETIISKTISILQSQDLEKTSSISTFQVSEVFGQILSRK
jgi:hypothetical protein